VDQTRVKAGSKESRMTTVGQADVRERDLTLPDGRRLHLYDSGDSRGELVIVHHGTPGSGKPAPWWAEDATAGGIRLVGYDRPGYGESDRHAGRRVADAAADVAAIADAVGVQRFRTYGGSGGGPHALACAALLPDRVIACVAFASPAPYGAQGLAWLAGMGQDNVDEFGAALAGEVTLRAYLAAATDQLRSIDASGLAGMLRTLLPDADLEVLDDDVAGWLHDGFNVGLRDGFEGWLDDDLAFVTEWGFEPSLIRVPVLLMHGRHDLMVPFAHGEWMASTIPDVGARLTDSDGHLTLVRRINDMHAWLLDQT
jgi:pimeloyl-ACP methyl ester carboxylesterase